MAAKQENRNTAIAFTTTLMAVLTALTSLYMGKFSSQAILIQGDANDQWAYYQAKSIKYDTYTLQKNVLELDLLSKRNSMSGPAAEKLSQTIAGYGMDIQKYQKQKEDIKSKAEGLEQKKALAQRKGGNFSYALIFLQVAIMLSSISVITKKSLLWVLGLMAALGGAAFFANGFYLWF